MLKKHKFNEKKLLHKIGKHWCIISIAVLGMIGGVSSYQQSANAMDQLTPQELYEKESSEPASNGDWSNITNKLNQDRSTASNEQNNPINSERTSEFDSSMNAYQQQVSQQASSESENAFNQREFNDARSMEEKYGSPLDTNDGGYDTPTSSTVDINQTSTVDNNPVIINNMSEASSMISSDMNVTTSISNRNDIQNNPDADGRANEDYVEVEHAQEELRPDDFSDEASLANSAASDATIIMPSNPYVSDNSIASDSAVVDNDLNQLNSDLDEVNSTGDEDTEAPIDNYWDIVSSADYIIGRDYSDDSEGYASEDGYTHSDDVNEAESLKDVANSASNAASNYLSSLNESYNDTSDIDNGDNENNVSDDSYSAPKRNKKKRSHKANKSIKKSHKHYKKYHNKRGSRKHHKARRYYRRKAKIYKKQAHKRHYRRRKVNRSLPKTFSAYWNHPHYVRVKHGFRAYEIHDVIPEYKSKVVKSKWMRFNRKFSVKRHGIEWMWTLGGKGLRHHGHYYWIFNGDESHPNHFKRI